jgi:hypothetical protein
MYVPGNRAGMPESRWDYIDPPPLKAQADPLRVPVVVMAVPPYQTRPPTFLIVGHSCPCFPGPRLHGTCLTLPPLLCTSPALPCDSEQRFKYNELETLLLVTSMFILLAGKPEPECCCSALTHMCAIRVPPAHRTVTRLSGDLRVGHAACARVLRKSFNFKLNPALQVHLVFTAPLRSLRLDPSCFA